MAQFFGLAALNAGNFESGNAGAGEVLTADGSGGAAWAQAGGGVQDAAVTTRTYKMPMSAANVGYPLAYLPYGHHYNYGYGDIAAFEGVNSPLAITEVQRRLCVAVGGKDRGETKHASTVDWCNTVRLVNTPPWPFNSYLLWTERTINWIPPALLPGSNHVEWRGMLTPKSRIYTGENVSFSEVDGSGNEIDSSRLMLPELPAGYVWEIWRRRKRRPFSGFNPNSGRRSAGNWVLFDRLAANQSSYLPHKKHRAAYSLVAFCVANGARSLLGPPVMVVGGARALRTVV